MAIVDLWGTHIELRGERVGVVQGQTAFLYEELSGRDKRSISDAWKEHNGHSLRFAEIGTLNVYRND